MLGHVTQESVCPLKRVAAAVQMHSTTQDKLSRLESELRSERDMRKQVSQARGPSILLVCDAHPLSHMPL
jgi:hypothetical protein